MDCRPALVNSPESEIATIYDVSWVAYMLPFFPAHIQCIDSEDQQRQVHCIVIVSTDGED